MAQLPPKARRKTVTELPADELPDSEVKYNAPKQVTLEALVEQDQDDESLAKYKAQLLGNAADAKVYDDSNPNKVVISKAHILFLNEHKDRPEVELDMNDAKLTEKPVVIQENAEYKIRVAFYVQRDIVLGLKWVNIVKKMGIRVDKDTTMMGSFAPASDPYVIEMDAEQAPSGMLGRGKYTCTGRLIDDDGMVQAEFDYAVHIKKQFE
jgi:Rho GDP-dissociation inhibitor